MILPDVAEKQGKRIAEQNTRSESNPAFFPQVSPGRKAGPGSPCPASHPPNAAQGRSLSFFGTRVCETDAENPQVNR
jgi:hypothetical protein